jgi:hypothetical protein
MVRHYDGKLQCRPRRHEWFLGVDFEVETKLHESAVVPNQ